MSIKHTPPPALATLPLQKSILGSLVLNSDLYYNISDLQPIMFATGTLRNIATDIWQQIDEGANINAAILAGQHGDIIYELPHKADVENIKFNAAKVKESYLSTEDARIWSQASARLIGGDDYNKVLADVENERELLHGTYNIQEDQRVKFANEAVDFLARIRTSDNGIAGVPYGYFILDRATKGAHPGNFIILAARPGMGKTEHCLEMIINNIEKDNATPDGLISIEMSGEEITSKLAAKLARVDYDKILGDNEEIAEATEAEISSYINATQRLQSLPIYIDDQASKLAEVKTAARRMVRQYGIKRLWVDYLQLIAPPKVTGNGNYETQSVSRAMKDLAKELQIPIIALSQLSRAAETEAGSKRPKLRHLRDSGSLEQDAHFVFFIHRPEYYEIFEDAEGNSLRGLTEIIIAKNRLLGSRTSTINPRWSDWRRYTHEGRHETYTR